MIKLKQHAKGIKPACLPSPNYKDTNIKAIIAGYGKNRRAPCQVGSKGPSKYRYCGIEEACYNFETEKFKEANCSVTFTYQVRKKIWRQTWMYVLTNAMDFSLYTNFKSGNNEMGEIPNIS